MTVIWISIAGALAGSVMALPRGDGYDRVCAAAPGSAWRVGAHAAWPMALRDLAGLLLVLPFVLLWPSPSLAFEAWLTLPLLVWLLTRGWILVETPPARIYLSEDPVRATSSAEVIGGSLTRPGPLLLRLVVSWPLVGILVRGPGYALPLFCVTAAAGFFGLHVLFASSLRRRRAGSGRPYLVRPDVARPLLGGAGLVCFGAAFSVFGTLLHGLASVTGGG